MSTAVLNNTQTASDSLISATGKPSQKYDLSEIPILTSLSTSLTKGELQSIVNSVWSGSLSRNSTQKNNLIHEYLSPAEGSIFCQLFNKFPSVWFQSRQKFWLLTSQSSYCDFLKYLLHINLQKLLWFIIFFHLNLCRFQFFKLDTTCLRVGWKSVAIWKLTSHYLGHIWSIYRYILSELNFNRNQQHP